MSEKYNILENQTQYSPNNLMKQVNIEEKFPHLYEEPIFIKHPELIRNPNGEILEKIHYENMKLNAQIEVLNKVTDQYSHKIEELKDVNYELRKSNKELTDLNNQYKKNNKNSGIKNFIWGVLITIFAELVLKYVFKI